MTQCYHVHLTVKQSETTTWFEVGDSDFKALFKVICATWFSNDMKKCRKFVHTGKLESFHNLKLMYLPKSTGFTMLTCIIMTMLAAIQNQVYIEQKNSAKVHYVAQWSRASKKHVVKKRTEYDSVSFKKTIIGEVNSNLTPMLSWTWTWHPTWGSRFRKPSMAKQHRLWTICSQHGSPECPKYEHLYNFLYNFKFIASNAWFNHCIINENKQIAKLVSLDYEVDVK